MVSTPWYVTHAPAFGPAHGSGPIFFMLARSRAALLLKQIATGEANSRRLRNPLGSR